MIPSVKGQYRRVKHTIDGCSVWQCLWCLETIEIRDDPELARWNFCPKCGRSWFTRLECRETTTPRWFWDKFGRNARLDDFVCPTKWEPTHEWVLERWDNRGWVKDDARDHNPICRNYMDIYLYKERLSCSHTPYRIKLRRKT